MPETLDFNDKGCSEAPKTISLSSADLMELEKILPSSLTLNPFKKEDSSIDIDSLTLNPFEKDQPADSGTKFLDPFAEGKQQESKDQPAGDGSKFLDPFAEGKQQESRSLNVPSLHRPKFPENVEGAEPYVVKRGDCLSGIARKVLKDRTGSNPSAAEVSRTVDDITRTLGETDPAGILLYPGDKIFIPLSGSSALAATAAAPEAAPSSEAGKSPDSTLAGMSKFFNALEAPLKGAYRVAQRPLEEVYDAVQDRLGKAYEALKSHIKEVKYPNDTSRIVALDATGLPVALTYMQGDKLYDQWQYRDGIYHQYKPDNEGTMQPTGDTFEGTVTFNAETQDLTYKLGPNEVTERADGTKVEACAE